jgi:hypothetical protein
MEEAEMVFPIAASSKPATKGFTAWSFSRYNAYVKCPLAAKLSNIDKIPQPPSTAMDRGSMIHGLAAGYISGELPQMPESLLLFKDLFIDLRARYNDDEVIAEDSWAFRKDWSVTTFDDWDNCWCRIKVDAVRLIEGSLDVLDWKTGKYAPQYNVADYELQIELYSLGALLMFGGKIPDIRVAPRLIYLDHGIVHPEKAQIYTMKDLPRLKTAWEKRTTPMLVDRTFAPNPGQQCTWCAYSKTKSGHCVY